MDDVYQIARYINFAWATILFFVMLWWGIIDIMLNKKCTHTHAPPEFMLWAATSMLAVFTIAFGTGEVLLEPVKGGIRVLLPWTVLLAASFALRMGIARVRFHRISIERGACH